MQQQGDIGGINLWPACNGDFARAIQNCDDCCKVAEYKA